MRNGYLMVAALALAGCASDGYRYHDDGYWTAREVPRVSVSYSIGYGYGGVCSPGYGAYSYPRFGYGWASCGYGYGPWYGAGYGYWNDPYWSQRWYLPPRTIEAPRAGSRARSLADDTEYARFPRYEDLAPTRQRDLGGGDRAWRIMSSAPERGSTPSQQGLGSVRYERSSGLSSGMNSGSSNRDSRSSRSSGFSSPAPRMSAGSAARSSSRDTREED